MGQNSFVLCGSSWALIVWIVRPGKVNELDDEVPTKIFFMLFFFQLSLLFEIIY